MLTRRNAVRFLSLGVAVALGISNGGRAQAEEAKELPAEIAALSVTLFKAFNAKDIKLLSSLYAGNLVIIDGFAPYRWIGPDALTKWWADAEVWAKEGGVESEVLTNKGTLAWGVVGDRGYISISAVLTIKLKNGKQIVRPGVLTLTLAKLGDEWKAEGHAWGRMI